MRSLWSQGPFFRVWSGQVPGLRFLRGWVGSAHVTSTPGPVPPSPARRGAPAPLLVAASLTAVEAVLLVFQGLAEVVSISGERVTMGVTTALFFVVYGVALGFCAWTMTRLKSWARAPVVVAQLIQLLVAWSFVGGATTALAVGLGVVALLVLVGIFHPASIRAMGGET